MQRNLYTLRILSSSSSSTYLLGPSTKQRISSIQHFNPNTPPRTNRDGTLGFRPLHTYLRTDSALLSSLRYVRDLTGPKNSDLCIFPYRSFVSVPPSSSSVSHRHSKPAGGNTSSVPRSRGPSSTVSSSPSNSPNKSSTNRSPPSKPTNSSASSSSSSSSSSTSVLRPIINEAITFPTVRVLEGKNNHGIMPRNEALDLAKKNQTDLVLFVPTADPPICRLISVKDYVQETQQKQQKEAVAAEEKLQAKKEENKSDRKQKEIRLTSRTDDHDLGVKTGKIIEFLRNGHSVKISITFTLSAWQKEEPARREVLAKIVRRVAESGIGWIDPSSISGQGAALLAICNPVNHPKNKADWDKVLIKLTNPLNSLNTNDARVKMILPTVAAAVDGTAKATTITDILPPTELLIKTYRSPKAHNGRLAHSSIATGTDLKKEEENKNILADPDVPVSTPRRRRRVDSDDPLPPTGGRQRRSGSSSRL